MTEDEVRWSTLCGWCEDGAETEGDSRRAGSAGGSLAEALAVLPEARRPYGWSPGRSPLPLAGMLCGARSLYAVAQWARERVEEDAEAPVPLGLPAGRSPSVATLHRVFKRLDVAAFERALGACLERTGAERVSALALVSSAGRGYRAPVSEMILLLFLAQILAAIGWGPYLPWSVPRSTVVPAARIYRH